MGKSRFGDKYFDNCYYFFGCGEGNPDTTDELELLTKGSPSSTPFKVSTASLGGVL